MRSVDESEIGSAKVLPPEELRLSWWQNLFFVAESLTTFGERRGSIGSPASCSRYFLLQVRFGSEPAKPVPRRAKLQGVGRACPLVSSDLT
jgi:hypothetical protein